MFKIEISSYPKSGNTWFRRIIEDYIYKLEGKTLFPIDIHQNGISVVTQDNAEYLNCVSDYVIAYKSHIHDHPEVNPDLIINIQRHPLDVFLSARNFLFIHSSKNTERINKIQFKNGIPKSVEKIIEDGEMDYYFDDFLENAGANYWPHMLDSYSNYFNYINKVYKSDKTFVVRYEDLENDIQTAVNEVLNKTLKISKNIIIDTNAINKKTKFSKNKDFYWKAKSGNYHEILTEDQITSFKDKYSFELDKIGY